MRDSMNHTPISKFYLLQRTSQGRRVTKGDRVQHNEIWTGYVPCKFCDHSRCTANSCHVHFGKCNVLKLRLSSNGPKDNIILFWEDSKYVASYLLVENAVCVVCSSDLWNSVVGWIIVEYSAFIHKFVTFPVWGLTISSTFSSLFGTVYFPIILSTY
jgi:hypothetical protein